MDLNSLHLLGIDFRSGTPSVRNALAVAKERVREMNGLANSLETMIVSTCNRTEIFTSGTDSERVCRALSHLSGVSEEVIDHSSYELSGIAVARHLFRVCSGLESASLGETEIVAQVRDSFRKSKQEGALGFTLGRVSEAALRASKRVRTETQVARGSVSLASFAVQSCNLRKGSKVLVIGAGKFGERIVQELISQGAEVWVCNRTNSKADSLASLYNCNSLNLDQVDASLDSFEACFSAISEPLRTQKPVVQCKVVDLSVPPSLPAGWDRVVSLSELMRRCEENSTNRVAAIEHAEEIIEQELQKLIADADRRSSRREAC